MSTAAPRPPTKVNDEAGRPRRGAGQQFAWWVRWLHIYLSLFSFAALLFFAVTGLTLNHPTWLGGSDATSRTAQGQLPIGSAGNITGGGVAPIPPNSLAVRLIVDDKDKDLFLASGAHGAGAIYTDSGKMLHIPRKVIIRVGSKLDWLIPKLH